MVHSEDRCETHLPRAVGDSCSRLVQTFSCIVSRDLTGWVKLTMYMKLAQLETKSKASITNRITHLDVQGLKAIPVPDEHV